jgi:hypothetical protein
MPLTKKQMKAEEEKREKRIRRIAMGIAYRDMHKRRAVLLEPLADELLKDGLDVNEFKVQRHRFWNDPEFLFERDDTGGIVPCNATIVPIIKAANYGIEEIHEKTKNSPHLFVKYQGAPSSIKYEKVTCAYVDAETYPHLKAAHFAMNIDRHRFMDLYMADPNNHVLQQILIFIEEHPKLTRPKQLRIVRSKNVVALPNMKLLK